jgi:hypothetical protein
MAFVFFSKRSGQAAKGGGCIGCIPIPLGCLSLFAGVAALVMLVL